MNNKSRLFPSFHVKATMIWLCLFLFSSSLVTAQEAYLLGDDNNNQFTEVKSVQNSLFATGTMTDNVGNTYGTFSEINPVTGLVVWTAQLDIPSRLNDFVIAGDEFIAVGRTEPIQDAATGAWLNNQSLVCKISMTGAVTQTRVYQVDSDGGREGFTKIVRNTSALDAAYPFYVSGHADLDGNGNANSIDDLIVTNIDFNLNVLFTRRYFNSVGNVADEELNRVLISLNDGSGQMVLMGNEGTSGTGTVRAVAFYINNDGSVVPASERHFYPTLEVIQDAILLPNRQFVIVGRNAQNTNFIMKTDGTFNPFWAAQIPEHQQFVKIIQHQEDYYTVMVERNSTNQNRYIVNRIRESGIPASPFLTWSKTLHDNDNTFSHPFIHSTGSQIVYGNSRIPDATGQITSGYGAQDIMLAVTDETLETCITQTIETELIPISVEPQEYFISSTTIDMPSFDAEEWHAIEYASTEVCESSCPSDCVTNSININTGYDHVNGTTYAPGAYDAFWTLVQSPDPGITLPRPAYAVNPSTAWDNQTNTSWISAYPFSNFNQNNTPPAIPYTFQFCFCVCEDDTDVTFDLSAYADNNVFVDLYDDTGGFITDLVDVTSTTTSAFQAPPETNIVNVTLNEGTYCIKADLHNLSAVAMGFNMMGTITGGSLIEPLCCSDANFITGFKFNDKDCNGTFSGNTSSEPLLSGWDIQVCDNLNNVVATATTDALGFYVIPNLPPGTYTVKEVNQVGWVQTYPGGSGIHTVTIAAGEVVADINFGNINPEECNCTDFFFTENPNPDHPDDCCYDIILDTNVPDYYTGVKITPVGGSFTAWNANAADWNYIGVPSATGIQLEHISGMIPAGSHNAINVCISTTTTVLIEWLVGDEVICEDERVLECEGVEPCDKLMAMFDHIPNPDPTIEECCYEVDLKNYYGTNVTRFEATIMTPGVIFDSGTVSGGYTWDVPNTTSTNLSVNFGGGNLPTGDFLDVIEFCLANTTTSSIFATTIVYRWYEQIPGTDEIAICEQVVTLQCELLPPPTSCVELLDIRVDCDEDGNYVFKFKVKNNTALTADHVLLYNVAPAGFTFDDIYPSFPPLLPGQTSGDICLLITPTSPVLSPTNLCFDIALFGTAANGSAYPCCFSDDEVCITLDPCCDPCEGTSVDVQAIQVSTTEETCCWAMDLTNECEPSIFTKVEIEVTTAGVIFGSHFTGGTNPADWNNPLSLPTRIQWAHNSGMIPNGFIDDVINFCLDDIDNASEVPQTIVVKWITTDAAGNDVVACEEVLTLDCPFEDYHCAEITEDVITCNEDGTYNYCFTVTNTSTDMHDATHILLNPTMPSGITFSPDAFAVTLPFGASVTICTTISSTSPLSPGDKITFEVRLANLTAADHWCCFESEEHCVFIPECPDDCCDVSPNDFHDWVNQGFNWNVSSNDCKLITATPNYDFDEDCDKVTWIWGDGSPNDNSTGNNSVTHIYPSNGAYTICMIVTRYAPDGTVCQVAEWCETIQIDCPADCCDISPNEFHDWVNQGFTWGLTTTTDCKTITATPNFDFDEDCDRVTWLWGDGSSNSNSAGNTSVMHTFPGTGTYFVCMIVTRYAPDGTICQQAEWCTEITIECPMTDDCCDISPNEFHDWVNQNFYVSLSASDCKTIFVDPAFNFDEDCDEITWIWGDGTPNTVVMGNGTVSHTYPGNGVYQLCMIVTRYAPDGSICMQAEICQDVPIENCDCLCDEAFYDAVNAGYIVTTGFCRNRTFTASEVGLNDCDKVVWSVQGPGVPGLGFMGTSFSFNFPSNGYYEICMYVTRTNPITGEQCEAVYCKRIRVTCSPWVVVHTVNVLSNYGFATAFNPFTTDNTTRRQMVDWQTAMGTPEVIEDSEGGCEDENFAQLAGNKTSVDGLQQLVTLEANTYYDLSYCYQFLTAQHGQPKVGTEVVFRASKIAQTSPDCAGDCEEIGRFTLSTNPADAWSSVQQAPYYSGDMSGNVYITIHIENGITDDGTDATKSIINIDNIVLEATSDNCDDDNVDITDAGFVVTGYPNVKAKTDLTSNVTIGGGAVATYKAGNSITLNGGFEVMLGTDMTIDIEDCNLVALTEENTAYRDDNDTDLIVAKVASLYCYPNPFTHNATIEYELPESGTVQISVFNITGKQVTNLLPNQSKDAGQYQVTFDANNLADGIYYVRMAANGQVTTQKIVLLNR